MRTTGRLWMALALLVALSGCDQPERVAVLDDRPALVAAPTYGGVALLPKPVVYGEPPEGLKLVLALKEGQDVFETGATIPVEAKLVNESDAAVDVVMPGDGSYRGWREPAVRFSAEQRGTAGFAPMKAETPSGCGNYDSEWQDDLAAVPAHGELPLQFWASPGMYLDFYEPGDVRLFAHYEYAAGQGRRSGGPVPDKLAGVPAYKLISNAVALRIERPLELSIEVLGQLESGEGSKLSEVLAVRVHNRSERPRKIGSPFSGGYGDHSFWLRVDDDSGEVSDPSLAHNGDKPAASKMLGPGETLTLVGPDEAFSSEGSHWTVSKPGKIRVRASYGPRAENYQLLSDWVTVEAR